MTPDEEARNKAGEAEINQILFKDFKQFADSARLYFANDFFALRINVGHQGFTYVLTPYLAKALSQVFSEQIKRYEQHIRPIPTDQPSLSPLQAPDLKQPGDEDKGQNGSDKPKDGK